VLSSAFPNVKGSYNRSKIGLNLFTLFVAPPASKKGQIKWSATLVGEIEENLKKEYAKNYSSYKATGEKEGAAKPERKKFIIGADISTAALFKQMSNNDTFGVMFDTEGSTLSEMYKTDWGNSTNILLKAFENEPCSLDRKEESLSVDRSFLSVVLSATPTQVPKIIGEISSGLYSRFLVYSFKGAIKWKDQFTAEGESLDPVFEAAASEVFRMWTANQNGETMVRISEEKRSEIFDYFSGRLQEFYSEYGRELLANVYRTCLIFYRIARYLTIVTCN
jgi:hypothetical protein